MDESSLAEGISDVEALEDFDDFEVEVFDVDFELLEVVVAAVSVTSGMSSLA